MSGANDNNQNNNTSPCQYYVSHSPLSPEAGELVTLQVTSTGNCSPSTYDWTVTDPDGLSAIITVRNPPRSAELVAEKPGSYQVSVAVFDSLTDSTHTAVGGFTATDPTGDQRTYLIRFTPPSSAGVPRQQEVLTVTGNTPLSGHDFNLDPGAVLTNTLTGPGGTFAAYLRLIQSGFPLYREVHVDAAGSFSVAMLADVTYDVVVIPDDDTPAPVLLSGLTLFDLQDAAAFTVDAGVPVTGYVLDASALPVTDTQVGLRNAMLPSGVGTADWFDGRFTLLARPGDQAMEIVPPGQTGLPRVSVPASADLEVDTQTNLELSFSYAPLVQTSVDLRVVLSPAGGGLPVEDARVTLEATHVANVGTLTVSRDGSEVASIDADGSFRATSTTAADGRIGAVLVPAGTYRVIIEAPADVDAGHATTIVQTLVVSGASQSEDLELAAPSVLEGTVLDDSLAPRADVRVVAMTDLGLGSAVEGVTDSSGEFSLDVVGGAHYTVLVMPEPSSGLGRLRIASVYVLPSYTTMGALALPAGLPISGVVRLQSAPIPGVLIQAIPLGVAGEPVLAETVTGAGGDYVMVLPDPGVAP